MTACPIRYQRQVPDRKGKIFYTSITSLSHIRKVPGNEAAYGRRRCGSYRNYTCSFTFWSFLRDRVAGSRRQTTEYGEGAGPEA
mgnify:CR=1 FL=1